MNAAKYPTALWLVPLVLFLATMFQCIASDQDKNRLVPADVKTPEAATREPSAESLRENLVMNSGFEKSGQDELEYWALMPAKSELSAITVDGAESHSGNSSLRISQANADSFSVCKQNIPVEPGTDYTVTCWMKGENIVITEGCEGAHVLIGKTDGHGIKGAAIQQGSFPWKKTAMTFNSGSENTVTLQLYLHLSTGDVWYDDIEMVKGLE
ncbi:MAG: carbohydrate binding domain-containing protein [Phycisphaerae bacterium]|jgi:hypothetical protein